MNVPRAITGSLKRCATKISLIVAALALVLLPACAHLTPAPLGDRLQTPDYDRGYAHGYADARAAAAETPPQTVRIIAPARECPPPGDGLIKDRRPTAPELRRELNRVLLLYIECARPTAP